MNTKTSTARPLSTIASEIIMDMESQAKAKGKYWRKMFWASQNYADAMMSLNTINDHYMFDDGRMIVAGFLSNVGTWKGAVARRIKVELKEMMKK